MGAAPQADADVDTSKTKKKSFYGFVQVAIRTDVLAAHFYNKIPPAELPA